MTLDTMTVGELKTYLEEFPDSAKVVFSFPAGDQHTQLIGAIKVAEYANVTFSGYHQLFQVHLQDDDKGQEVLILGV